MLNFAIKNLKSDLEIMKLETPIEGFHYKLKNNKVKEIIIVNPQIIDSLITYYFDKKYKKILETYLNFLQEDEDNPTDTGFLIALDDIARLRNILIAKYNLILSKKKREKCLKKLKILENEIRSKIIDFRLIKEQELGNTMGEKEKSKSR